MLEVRQVESETANENLRVQEGELRHQAEALRESEGRYRTLFDAAPDAIVVHREGRFLAANHALLRLAGAGSFQELAARTILDFFRPGERQQAAERVRQALAGRRQPIRECTLVRLDGREVVVELHTGPIDFQGGPAVQTIIRDITERKQAEEALRREAQVLAQVHDSIIATDLDGHITFWNQGAERQYGYTAEEALGRSVSTLYFPEDLSVLRDRVIAPTLAAGQHELELRSRAKSGQTVFVHLSLSMLHDEHGSPCGMIGYSLDITERKRAEEALRAKEAQLQVIADATPVLLTRLNRDLRYVFVNRACAKMFGRPPEEIVGKPIVEIMGKEAFETIRPYVERVLRGERVEYETEIPYQGIGTRLMHVTYTPERNAQGEVVGWLASVLDVSDRKRAEETLRQALADSQQRCAEISALMTCTRAVLECRDLVSGTRAVFTACRELLGAPAGYVARPDPGWGNRRCAALGGRRAVLQRGPIAAHACPRTAGGGIPHGTGCL